MPFSPSIVPSCEDQDVYLLRDQFGDRLGRAWRATDEADFETLIRHLLEGQYSNPGRAVAFNTAEGWSRMSRMTWLTSSEIAEPSAERCPPSSRSSWSAMIAVDRSSRPALWGADACLWRRNAPRLLP
jgi:hypothetical protein